MSSIVHKSISVLQDLSVLIDKLNDDEYIAHVESLNNSSIGEHTRHILEMFEELMSGYDTGTVNYDNRKRNKQLETVREAAIQKIEMLTAIVSKPNKPLILEQGFITSSLDINRIDTNYLRELAYNIEHSVHHKALIRVAIHSLGLNNQIDDSFGYADSTLIYKSQTAS